ncbi:MAG TPA: hypothetical protein VIO56_04090 [Methylotenera sp.]|jgi:hypothetical protein
MKHILVMVAAFVALSGCVVVPAGHHPNGPGNSENAPGHNKACGEGPGNSGSAPGQVKKNCY